jgi:hypothetical protein
MWVGFTTHQQVVVREMLGLTTRIGRNGATGVIPQRAYTRLSAEGNRARCRCRRPLSEVLWRDHYIGFREKMH